jgi:D-amino-acid dehydrogenase
MRHIAIIGAGITGITTAYALLDRGYAVTVIDRHRYAAMETSFANGGQLSASNAEVWNGWSTMLKGMKWILDTGAPLLMNPKPSWHKMSWLAEFVAAIPHYERNTVETVRLAIAARDHLFAMARREHIDFDAVDRGILHIYRDRASYDHAARVNGLLRQGGLERRPVTPGEIRSIEPTIRGDYFGGFFTPSDTTGDIHKFTVGLARACERRGADLVTDAEVTAVTSTDRGMTIDWVPSGRPGAKAERIAADAVVICAGVHSRALAASLGDRVNIYPVKGYSITVHLDSEASRAAAPTVSLLDDATKIVSSRLGPDRFRVAGTAEFNGFNRDIRENRIKPLVNWTRALFPGVETERVVAWAGLRPMMPNMLPRVGRGRRDNVFYNTGHGHLGWTLSAATAQIIAETIAGSMPVEHRAAA